MKNPFELKNFVKFTKAHIPELNCYINQLKKEQFIQNVLESLKMDGYFDWYNAETPSSLLKAELSQFLLQRVEQHFDDRHFFKASTLMQEIQPYNVYKYGFYTHQGFSSKNPNVTNNDYDIETAIIAYIVSLIRLTTLNDLGWQNWD